MEMAVVAALTIISGMTMGVALLAIWLLSKELWREQKENTQLKRLREENRRLRRLCREMGSPESDGMDALRSMVFEACAHGFGEHDGPETYREI